MGNKHFEAKERSEAFAVNTKRIGWISLVGGILLTAIGIGWIVVQKQAGTQPWGPLLSDNLLFAKGLPFLIGLGILVGAVRVWQDRGTDVVDRVDGHVRRFSMTTVLNHWVNAIGFLLALGTGAVQYLSGILDVPPPLPLYLFYRVHYIGAALIVFSVTSFITHRLLIGDHRLLPEWSRWAPELRGLVEELPRFLGVPLAFVVGLNLRRPAPPMKQFTFYERIISFPIWTVLLALLLLTGLIKAERYVYPVPGALLFWASAIHVGCMIVLTAKLLDHLRFVLSPRRWPLLVAMFTGWVSEAYAKEHHPAWYADALAEQQSQETERAATREHPTAQTAEVHGGN